MGFDLGGAVNSAGAWASTAPIIRSVVTNPFAAALLITALVAIVGLSLYSKALRKKGGKTAARAFVYIYLLSAAVMFLHHYATLRRFEATAHKEAAREVFSGLRDGVTGAGDWVPVMPQNTSAYSTAPQYTAAPSLAPNVDFPEISPVRVGPLY